jgi:hypothetical protein
MPAKSIAHFGIMASAAFVLSASLVQAQSTINDPTPVLGNGVTGTASNAQMNSALNAHSKCPKNTSCKTNPKGETQIALVNALITQYHSCRRRAADVSSTPAQKDKLRKSCVADYNPKFAKSCVGAASSIAICERLRTRGTIDRP